MNINNLSDSLLTKICSFLEDREVIAFGLTSKKIKKIAEKELNNRDEILEQLFSPYTISRKFNVQSLKECDLFLIGDVHYKCDQIHGPLINFLASRGPVILILEENTTTIFDENAVNRLCKRRNISFKENIHVIGWDDKDDKIFDTLNEIELRIGKVLDKKLIEINNLNLLCSNLSIEESSLLEKAVFEKGESFLLTLPLEMLEKVLKITEWQRKAQKLQKEYEKLIFLRRQEHIELEPFMPKELFKNAFENNEEEIKKFRKTRRHTAEDYDSEIFERFPIRTKSMVRTINEIENFIVQHGLVAQ